MVSKLVSELVVLLVYMFIVCLFVDMFVYFRFLLVEICIRVFQERSSSKRPLVYPGFKETNRG